jgi:hypothetical protein
MHGLGVESSNLSVPTNNLLIFNKVLFVGLLKTSIGYYELTGLKFLLGIFSI